MSLRKIIEGAASDAPEYVQFRNFLEKEGAAVWLDFCVQVTNLEERHSNDEELIQATVQQVYGRFFHKHAPQKLDMDRTVVKAIQNACSQKDETVNRMVFHDARGLAYDHLAKDYLPRFSNPLLNDNSRRMSKFRIPTSASENNLAQMASDKPRKDSKEKRRKKKPSKSGGFELSAPSAFKHTVHVDTDYNWSGLEDPKEEFTLTKTLGKGSFGTVHLAVHKSLDLEIAIKILQLSDDTDELEKEINILRRCKNENIVRYYGCFTLKSEVWILMDYCSGGSTLDLVKKMKKSKRTLTELELAAILSYVIQGIVYLHSVPIIHRDVKAGNILLTNDGEVKIADFGVSAQILGGTEDNKRRTMKGTPLWMAPEVLKTDEYDVRADVWSLGITAIELAEGNPPHFDTHLMRAMMKIMEGPPPNVSIPEMWSSEFRDFLHVCLRKEKEQRPSAIELLDHPFIRGVLRRERAKIIRDLLSDVESLECSRDPTPDKPAPSSGSKIRKKESNEHVNGAEKLKERKEKLNVSKSKAVVSQQRGRTNSTPALPSHKLSSPTKSPSPLAASPALSLSPRCRRKSVHSTRSDVKSDKSEEYPISPLSSPRQPQSPKSLQVSPRARSPPASRTPSHASPRDVDDMDSDALREELKGLREANKKLRDKLKRTQQENEKLHSTNTELEQVLAGARDTAREMHLSFEAMVQKQKHMSRMMADFMQSVKDPRG